MSKSDKVKVSFVVVQIIKLIVSAVFIAVFVLFFTSFFADLLYYMTHQPVFVSLTPWSSIFSDLVIRAVYIAILGFIFAHVYRDDELIPAIGPPSILAIFFYGYVISDIFLNEFFALIRCNSDFVAFLSENHSFSVVFIIPYLIVFIVAAVFTHRALNKNDE